MSKNKHFSAKSADLIPLSKAEQSQIKGGILLYCEEKRKKVKGGTHIIVPTWRTIKDDNSFLTVIANSEMERAAGYAFAYAKGLI
jgi:hypothetical protein